MEKFYIVTEKSPIHKQYNDYLECREKLRLAFIEFSKKHGIGANKYYATNEELYIVPTEGDLEKFKKVLKQPVDNGLMAFKKNSKISKDWVNFLKKINLKIIAKPYLGFVFRVYGRHWKRIFKYKDTIYCSFESENGIDFENPEGMQEIKASEFYKVIEEIEDES